MIEEPVPYVLEVWANGVRHELRNGIAFGRFEPLVYEFDVRSDGAAPASEKRSTGTAGPQAP
jgi:hypothetical protein